MNLDPPSQSLFREVSSDSYFATRVRGKPLRRTKSSEQLISEPAPIDKQQLEILVCETIPTRTGDRSGLRYRSLLEGGDGTSTQPQLHPIADWLQEILSKPVSQKLSAKHLSEIYSSIGCIRHHSGEYRDSQKAFISAAFIANKNRDDKALRVSLFGLSRCEKGKSGR